VEYDGLYGYPVEDAALAARLRDVSARFYTALRGASYGRCDLRVDADGTPWMLEINSNCGVFFPPDAAGGADLCIAADPEGHEGFTRRIISAALRRHDIESGVRSAR
jgi:D-alanine-D-alanine ligase